MILSTLQINTNYIKQSKVFIMVSLSLLCFSIIYNHFSHEVTSVYMTYLCLWTVPGAIYSLIVNRAKKFQNRLANNLICSGIGAITVGSCLRGIVEIAGASSVYIIYFFIVGVAMIFAGVIYSLMTFAKK